MEEGDELLTCIEESCGHREFVFTVGEQKFYAEKGFSKPKRCKGCRAAARKKHEAFDSK